MWLLVSLAGLALLAAAPAAAAATITVDTLEDTDAAACAAESEAHCSLREAINAVNQGTVSGDVTIGFSVEGTITVAASRAEEVENSILIEPAGGVDSVSIQGPGPEGLQIDCEETIARGRRAIRTPLSAAGRRLLRRSPRLVRVRTAVRDHVFGRVSRTARALRVGGHAPPTVRSPSTESG